VEELPAAEPGPQPAQTRSHGTWGSTLTADEFAALRGAGFEPVGQAFGAAVYAAGSASGSSCPGAWGSAGGGTPAQPTAQAAEWSRLGPFGPLVQAMYQARQAAIDRMAAECAQLGGHGVVGVRLSRGPFPFGGLQFTAIGTAVRAPGVVSGQRAPFTADVSGQDFAKLITTGWVPVGIALGISIGSRHDDWTTARQTRRWKGNAEVAGWTELVSQSRHDARRRLDGDVKRLGAEGVVLSAMRMHVRERDCPVTAGARDHIVEATLIGTAIVRFSRSGERQAGAPLTVMSLDPQRRQAARIGI
jgi:uncharacterized protein YbjQ (UPF0145 family)